MAQAQTQLETTRAQAIEVGLERAQFEHAIAVLAGEVPETFRCPPCRSGRRRRVPRRCPRTARSGVPTSRRRTPAVSLKPTRRSAWPAPRSSDLLSNAGHRLRIDVDRRLVRLASRLWSSGRAAVQRSSTAASAARDRSRAGQLRCHRRRYRETVLGAFQQVEDNLAALRILAQEAETQRAGRRGAQRPSSSHESLQGRPATYLEVVTRRASPSRTRHRVGLLERRMTSTVLLTKPSAAAGMRPAAGADVGRAPPRSHRRHSRTSADAALTDSRSDASYPFHRSLPLRYTLVILSFLSLTIAAALMVGWDGLSFDWDPPKSARRSDRPLLAALSSRSSSWPGAPMIPSAGKPL